MEDVGSKGNPKAHLIDLPSKKIYNDMNKEYAVLSNYSTECDSITWPKYADALKKICKKYITYLETSKELKLGKPDYNVCIPLNYWLYDKLTEIFVDENNLDNIRLAFGNLQLVWSKLYLYSRRTNHNKCKPEFETDNHEDWKNRKELYDYYVDYKELSFQAQLYDHKCMYYEEIKERQKLFDYFNRICYSSTNKCPQFYYDFKSYNIQNVISTLRCHKQVEQEKSAALAPEKDTKEGPLHEPAETKTQLTTFGVRPGETNRNDGSHITHSTPQISGIVKKVSESVLFTAPVLLTTTALYRVHGFVGSVEEEQII
ncbi:Plasmodium vivax Vir protein, putative [Plasmodium vivax]|uniref:Vir protein, putative n=1 Tax=Plasmodium vivax TaxID=5855 RepID=A0A1G4EBG2_PLAVI|nr:Plasmodium vivax Vir protein, putative [Plasmodium vivax]